MNVKSRLLPGLLLTTAAVAAALLAPVPVAGQAGKESFTGFAINMNSGPSTAVVDFTIERWSTDAERQRLLSLIKPERDAYEANQELQRVLQSLPKVGYIRTPDRLAWDLRYARQSPLDAGGRRIVLATDRPIGFPEARNQTRSMEYPFTTIEMHTDVASQAPHAKQSVRRTTKRVAYARDIEIAQTLHVGGLVLAEKYGLKVPSIYAAARRGRASLQLQRKTKP